MTDDELVEIATEAAVKEARRRGGVAPDEELPAGDDPPTAASVLVGMLGRRHLAHLRGEPSSLVLECRRRSAAHDQRMREQDAREKARRRARFDRGTAR